MEVLEVGVAEHLFAGVVGVVIVEAVVATHLHLQCQMVVEVEAAT
jgi:hypothetical protein